MQQNKRKYKYNEAKGRQQKYNEKDNTKNKIQQQERKEKVTKRNLKTSSYYSQDIIKKTMGMGIK